MLASLSPLENQVQQWMYTAHLVASSATPDKNKFEQLFQNLLDMCQTNPAACAAAGSFYLFGTNSKWVDLFKQVHPVDSSFLIQQDIEKGMRLLRMALGGNQHPNHPPSFMTNAMADLIFASEKINQRMARKGFQPIEIPLAEKQGFLKALISSGQYDAAYFYVVGVTEGEPDFTAIPQLLKKIMLLANSPTIRMGAQIILSMAYEFGYYGLGKNVKTAFEILEQPIQHHAHSIFLGKKVKKLLAYYLEGCGEDIKQSEVKAKQLLAENFNQPFVQEWLMTKMPEWYLEIQLESLRGDTGGLDIQAVW